MVSSLWVDTLALTLAHFLWQGFFVSLLLFGVLRWLKSATAKYLAAISAMALLLAIAGITFALCIPTELKPSLASQDIPKLEFKESRERITYFEDNKPSVSVEPLPTSITSSTPIATVTPLPEVTTQLSWQSWVVVLWLCGVAFFGLRFFFDWRSIVTLRKDALPLPADSEWVERFSVLLEKVRVSQTVQLLSSTAVKIPMVIGVLRPVIIVPVAMLANLPPSQVDAILLHELAHVRRRDFLVNLFQTIAETLFFFHPAIWWISARIREERENCCDDLASEVCGDVREYLGALAALEESRRDSDLAIGVAADGGKKGDLLRRIRRLAKGSDTRSGIEWTSILIGGLAGGLAALGVAFVIAMINEVKAAEKNNDWSSLKASSFGDKDRSIFCVYTDEEIHGVVVVELPRKNEVAAWQAGVLRSGQEQKDYLAFGNYEWGQRKLRIEFNSKNPDQLRLNDQTVLLNRGGKVIFWRQQEFWADQSNVLAADLPLTTEFTDLRSRIVKAFEPKEADNVIAPKELGQWDLGKGVTLEISEQSEETTAIIRWPSSETKPKLRHEIPLVNQSIGIDGQWALAMEKETRVVWVSYGSDSHQRIEFSNPMEIETNWANSGFNDMPSVVRAEMQKQFRLGKQLDKIGITYIGGNMAHNYTTTAAIDTPHLIRGLVVDDDSNPFAGVLIEAFTLSNPTNPVASTRSNEKGEWQLSFHSSLNSLKQSPQLLVRPNIEGYRDRDLEAGGELQIAIDKKEAIENALLPGMPSENITFRMLPTAQTITGTLVDQQGKPITNATVSVKVDEDEIPRNDGTLLLPGRSADSDITNEQGRFILDRVPSNRELHLVLWKRGESIQTEAFTEIHKKAFDLNLVWGADWSQYHGLECIPSKELLDTKKQLRIRVIENGKARDPADQVALSQKILNWVKTAKDRKIINPETTGSDTWEQLVAGENLIHVQFPNKELVYANSLHFAEILIELGKSSTEVKSVYVKTNSGRIDQLEGLTAEFRNFADAFSTTTITAKNKPPKPSLDRYQPTNWSDETHANLPFGLTNDEGLRVARFFEPNEHTYEVGTKVKGRIVFHNSGKAPVEFSTRRWHQYDKWHCQDAKGKIVRVEASDSTGFLGNWPMPIKLEPNEVCELDAQGTVIGTVPYVGEPNGIYCSSRIPDAEPADTISCEWDVTYIPKSTGKESTLRSGKYTFQVKARPADFPVDLGRARHIGKYYLAEGIMLQLSRSNVKTTATIEWENGRRKKLQLEQREASSPIKLITWWRGGKAFWIVEEEQLRKIDFSSSEKVKETAWKWNEVPSDFGGAPELVRKEIRRHVPDDQAANSGQHSQEQLTVQRYIDQRPVTKQIDQLTRLMDALGKFRYPKNGKNRITVWRQHTPRSGRLSITHKDEQITLFQAIDSFEDRCAPMDKTAIAFFSEDSKKLELINYTKSNPDKHILKRGQLVILLAPKKTDETGGFDDGDVLNQALQQIRDHQAKDGSVPLWSKDKAIDGQDSGVTALAGMALLVNGGTEKSSDYHEPMMRCLKYVLARQQENGYIKANAKGNGSMYHHSISTWFLANSLPHLGNDLEWKKRTEEVLTKAIKLLADAQAIQKNAKDQGGWRYSSLSRDSDLSCSAWGVRALYAAKRAGIPVAEKTLTDAIAYVSKLQADDGSFTYTAAAGGSNLPRAGMGLYCLSLAGKDKEADKAAAYILKNHRKLNKHYPYYGISWGSGAIQLRGGDDVKRYSEWMLEFLKKERNGDGRWHSPQGDILGTIFTILAMSPPEVEAPNQHKAMLYQNKSIAEWNTILANGKIHNKHEDLVRNSALEKRASLCLPKPSP